MRVYKLMFLFSCWLVYWHLNYLPALALEPGTILYRTSSEGKMYGLSSKELIEERYGVITNIYPGHAAIYIGQEDGVDYVVEALGTGIVKTPAHYFINESAGEALVAAKLPKGASMWQRARAVTIAKYLATADLAYDFDFSAQKGPWTGDWTCVGLTEKVYESANAANPERLGALEYNPQYYAVDITPDGYDSDSIYNEQGDCFSARREFSKIARRATTLLPLPEIIGYNAGKEQGNQRYIFLPYTQALQSTLVDVPVDIDLSSDFPATAVRGKVNNLGLILKWSLVNNPTSSLKRLAGLFGEGWSEALFPSEDGDALVWDEGGSIITAPTVEKSKVQVNSPLVAVSNPALAAKSTTTALVAKTEANSKLPSATITTEHTNTDNQADIFSAVRPITTTALSASTSQPTVSPVANTKTTAKTATTSPSSQVALWSPLVNKLTNTTTASNTVASVNGAVATESETVLPPLTLVLSRLHVEGNDDWVEIWNYGDQDIDLAVRKIRLEKSRTASDPGIILRFDAESDASFPGGTLLRAGEAYRVVRDDASADLLAAAQAIALRSDFTLTDSTYTIYLAAGAVSSPTDDDIIDVVGYGEATYFEGSGPAPALTAGYLLRRKAKADTKLADILSGGAQAQWPPSYDSDDNAHDWLLWPLGGVVPGAPVEDDVEDDDSGKEDETEDEDTDNNHNQSGGSADTSTPFTLLPGIESEALWRLWSFEECQGSTTAEMISGQTAKALRVSGAWSIGHWGCGQKLPYPTDDLRATLEPNLSGENFTLAFQFKLRDEYSHAYFFLENHTDNIQLRLDILKEAVEFYGFPGLEGQYQLPNYADNDWHQAVLVWNAANGYWSLFTDGVERIRQVFSGLAPGFDGLRLGSMSGDFFLDELALWNRALAAAEIATIFQAQQPFNPQIQRHEPPVLKLLHAWNFDEASGRIAHDSVGSLDWSLPSGALVYNGLSGRALNFPALGEPYQLNLPLQTANNFSLSGWWQSFAPGEFSGKMRLVLNHQDQLAANLVFSENKQQLGTLNHSNADFEIGSITSLADKGWHHFALAYDDYRYRWQLFIDGVLSLESQRLPLINQGFNRLTLETMVTDYKLDNFKLWQGALDATQVWAEYEAEKPQ